MGSGQIAIVIKDANIVVKQQCKELNVLDLGQLIAQLELMKMNYLMAYDSLCKKESTDKIE